MIGDKLRVFAFGQAMSLILAATGVINALLSCWQDVNAPSLQAVLTYSALAAVFHRHRSLPEKGRGALLGAIVFDIAANWMIVKAFAGLSLMQIILLQGLSTPASLLFSHFWQPRSYSRMQLWGIGVALISIVGYCVGSVVFLGGAWPAGWWVYWCLGGGAAVSYAASNNFQECAAKQIEAQNFLFWLGAGGGCISAVILVAFGRGELVQVGLFSLMSVMLIGAYVIVLAGFYSLIPVYLRKHSAVSFNLSLLTASFFAILGEYFIVARRGWDVSSWPVVGAIVGVNVGLVMFYLNDKDNRVSELETKSSV